MMLYVFLAAMVYCVLPRPGSKPPPQQKKARKSNVPRTCIIQYGARYWDGNKFTPTKSRAKIFPNDRVAWNYADTRFDEDVAESCHLISVKEAE